MWHHRMLNSEGLSEVSEAGVERSMFSGQGIRLSVPAGSKGSRGASNISRSGTSKYGVQWDTTLVLYLYGDLE